MNTSSAADQRVTFNDCIRAALDSGFVAEWLRLRGFALPKNGLEAMIDKATGHDAHIAATFLADVYDLIWCRLPLDARHCPG